MSNTPGVSVVRDFASTSDASEILGVAPGNVTKTMRAAGVVAQFLQQGNRKVTVYPRAAVVRVAEDRARNPKTRGRRTTS